VAVLVWRLGIGVFKRVVELVFVFFCYVVYEGS